MGVLAPCSVCGLAVLHVTLMQWSQTDANFQVQISRLQYPESFHAEQRRLCMQISRCRAQPPAVQLSQGPSCQDGELISA